MKANKHKPTPDLLDWIHVVVAVAMVVALLFRWRLAFESLAVLLLLMMIISFCRGREWV